jgi:hypothetical protein
MRDFAEDQRICDAATVGPWCESRLAAGYVITEDDLCATVASVIEYNEDGSEYMRFMRGKAMDNRRFIAEARTGWPAALERIRAQDAEIKQLRKLFRNTNRCSYENTLEVGRLRADNERLRTALSSIAEYQRDQYESPLYAYDNCKIIAREALRDGT